MADLARDPDVHLSVRTLRGWLAISPQFAAMKLSYVVERRTNADDYGHVTLSAVDGCRNGMLRYYYTYR
jgi:hypothetical protein